MITNVVKDPEAQTLVVTADFDAPVARVWEIWADPRQLERWWGPPTYPATFVDHDLSPGGWVSYFMTGPEGNTSRGWWRILTVDPPRHLEFEDGFATETGEPNHDMPTMTMRVALQERSDGGTQMSIETSFPTAEAMDRLLSMGLEEGFSAALGQIDDILAGATPR